jgi:hypothetical protein
LQGIALEEQQLAMQQYEADREGNNGHFILGFVFGLFFGPLALIWMFLRCSRKQKIGILFGICCYAILGIRHLAVSHTIVCLSSIRLISSHAFG